jgi:hypothetical protein
MTTKDEQEMHALAEQLERLTRGVGWEAMRYAAIGRLMERLAAYCAVCDCQRKKSA